MITAIHKALTAKRDAREENEEGFTLIELLVVVLIIGILAAIAIPVFLGQQNQAKDAAAKSDVGNAKIAVISYATANNGCYFEMTGSTCGTTQLTGADLSNYGFTATANTSNFTVIANAAGNFCISEQSAVGASNIYKILDSGSLTGPVSTSCTTVTG